MEQEKTKILFLCTGNAARSQMAEALARLHHGDVVEAVSAGSRPTGSVHPNAIAAMAELNSDISQARSKSAAAFFDREFEVVVTVCDSAARDCPSWPNAKRLEHWSIEDPSYEPDPVARAQRFRQTRDELSDRIEALIRGLRRPAPAEAAARAPEEPGPR